MTVLTSSWRPSLINDSVISVPELLPAPLCSDFMMICVFRVYICSVTGRPCLFCLGSGEAAVKRADIILTQSRKIIIIIIKQESYSGLSAKWLWGASTADRSDEDNNHHHHHHHHVLLTEPPVSRSGDAAEGSDEEEEEVEEGERIHVSLSG